MSAEHNKALVRRFVDEYQSGADERAFDELMHPDFVDRSLPPGVVPGPEGVRQQFDSFRTTFAGFHATIRQQVAEGDLVVTHKVFRGTHAGPFLGVEATGRPIEIAVIDIVRIADERIVEHCNVVDLFGALAQMGPAPMPAAA